MKTNKLQELCKEDGVKKAIATIEKTILKQQCAIRATGFDPTWDLFSRTLGWHQLKKKMSPKTQLVYEEIWKSNQK
jgi:hypothetical protein